MRTHFSFVKTQKRFTFQILLTVVVAEVNKYVYVCQAFPFDTMSYY